jgi:hypothetical protein
MLASGRETLASGREMLASGREMLASGRERPASGRERGMSVGISRRWRGWMDRQVVIGVSWVLWVYII